MNNENRCGPEVAFIRRMDLIDDHRMVALLKEGNDEAWRYVLLRAVVPVLRRPMIAKIKADRQLSDLDVLGMLFERLIRKGDIENYAPRQRHHNNSDALVFFAFCIDIGMLDPRNSLRRHCRAGASRNG